MVRIFRLSDPCIEIIYISPYEWSEDIWQYYMKVLTLGNVQDVKERLKVISPSRGEDYPSHYSLL